MYKYKSPENSTRVWYGVFAAPKTLVATFPNPKDAEIFRGSLNYSDDYYIHPVWDVEAALRLTQAALDCEGLYEASTGQGIAMISLKGLGLSALKSCVMYFHTEPNPEPKKTGHSALQDLKEFCDEHGFTAEFTYNNSESIDGFPWAVAVNKKEQGAIYNNPWVGKTLEDAARGLLDYFAKRT